MYKKLTALLLCFLMLTAILCGCKTRDASFPEGTEEAVANVDFYEYTQLAPFRDVPAVDMEKFSLQYARNYGDEYYVVALKSLQLPTASIFTDYVAKLEQAGFETYSDSGATGIGDGAMYAATLQKGKKVVSVTYAQHYAMLYVVASQNKPVSPHLLYDEAYVKDNVPDAKTTLTMNQLCDQGNCFVIQLKNGHYIVNDGGYPEDMDNLISSLERGAPEGQKPVVEAWFISHEHGDHVGVFHNSSLYADRVSVEGFYLNVAPPDISVGSNERGTVTNNAIYYKNAAGETTPMYRVHAGERYYFNDITVEVPHTTEQVPVADYADFNTTSIWLMYYIEGQKFLLAGDATLHSMRIIADSFDQSYFDVDMMNVHHHGINLFTDDLDYFKCETLLYSSVCHYSYYWTAENKANNIKLQQEFCEEYMSYADGGKKLTFPYTVGSYETLDPWYPELSEYWVERQEGWLRDAGLT